MSTQSEERTIGVILERIDNLNAGLGDLRKDMKESFVRKDEFWPVKTIVYGFVGIALTAVISTLVYSVVISKTPPVKAAEISSNK